jgi:hypothetical protein
VDELFATPTAALVGVSRLIAVAVALQTLELLAVRRVAADDGVWRWATVRRELDGIPRPLRWLLDQLLGYRGLVAVLAVRLIAALALLAVVHVALVAVLLVSTILLALRWRGSVNGGSDFMTLVVLTALTVATALPDRPLVTAGALLYIALQACNSYVVAGVVKLRSARWRDGTALPAFLTGAVHDPRRLLAICARAPWLARLAGWSVIALELSFPLALVSPRICAVLVGIALAFHAGNVHAFGLHRFLWAWAATYPALFYASRVVGAAL